ncbi:MAG: hypothetical protein Q7S23_02900 [bacterium]|nr:hypothetical protein [bacterium]
MEIGSEPVKKIEIIPTGLKFGLVNAVVTSGLFSINYFIQGLFSGFADEGLGIMMVTTPFVFLLVSLTVIPFFQIAYLKIKSRGISPRDQVKIFVLEMLFATIFNIIFYVIVLILSHQILEEILPNKIF